MPSLKRPPKGTTLVDANRQQTDRKRGPRLRLALDYEGGEDGGDPVEVLKAASKPLRELKGVLWAVAVIVGLIVVAIVFG